ncbi:MAG: permease [Pseudomonadota bacterium]
MTDFVLRRAGALAADLRKVDLVWVIILLIPLLIWMLDPLQVREVLEIALSALASTAPYILVAVAMIGMLKATGAEGVIAAAFKGQETRMIVLAALVGGLAPFCSCEVIPFVAALLAAGAPLAAVMAFWLASPLMDPPTFAITAGVLGPEFAIGKTIAAVTLGLMGGFAVKAMVGLGAFADPLKARKTSCCGCGTNPFTGKPHWRFWEEADRRRAFRDAGIENGVFLLKWMSLAYLLEGLLIMYVPADRIATVVGGEGLWPIVVGAFVGAPAYLNGYAAPALIDGLMDKGMSDGAAMSFLVAGAVSSIPAMAAVFALVKRPVFALYLALGIGGAILSGVIFAATLSVMA